MAKKPVASIDELARILSQARGNTPEVLAQQVLSRLDQQTFVGGKRVVLQKLPRLPKKAATTVHRVKVSLYAAAGAGGCAAGARTERGDGQRVVRAVRPDGP